MLNSVWQISTLRADDPSPLFPVLCLLFRVFFLPHRNAISPPIEGGCRRGVVEHEKEIWRSVVLEDGKEDVLGVFFKV